MVRWRLKLEEYDYNIVYKKGKLNTNADALSRVEIHTGEIDNASMIVNIQENTVKPEERLENETVHTSIEDPIITIPYTDKSVNTFKNQIIISINDSKENNIVKISREKIFENNRIYLKIPRIQRTNHIVEIIRTHLEPKNNYCLYFACKDLELPFIRTFQKYFKNKSFNLLISNTMVTDVIEEDEKQLKLKFYHETKTTHRGIQENLQSIKKSFYWPNMDKDVRDYVNTCATCQKSKYERHPNKLVFKPTPIGYEPFDHLYIDTYKYAGQAFLTIVDSFSKLGQAYPLKSINSIDTANSILRFLNHFGLPRKITCDNGIEFKNDVIQELCRVHQIEIHYTTIYNPNSNSPVERLHSTLAESLKIIQKQKPNETVTNLMTYAILSYNNSTHSSTGFTPFQIIKGKLNYKNPFEIDEITKVTQYVQEHSENLEILNSLIRNKLEIKQQTTLDKLNKNRHKQEINVNEPVYRKVTRFTNSKKATQPYVLANNPEIIQDNKIKTNEKIYHLNLIKPQRLVSEHGTRQKPDSIHTSRPITRSQTKAHQEPITPCTPGTSKNN